MTDDAKGRPRFTIIDNELPGHIADIELAVRGLGWHLYKSKMAFGRWAYQAYPLPIEKNDSWRQPTTLEELHADKRPPQISSASVPTFMSAPTWASDGIVLEWVRGQKFSIRHFFFRAYDDLIQERVTASERYKVAWPEVLTFHQKGDWAKAVLASTNAEDGTDG